LLVIIVELTAEVKDEVALFDGFVDVELVVAKVE
jgi:hypothetical protein